METYKTKRFDELKATGQLPSPTGIAMQILQMAQNEDAGVAQIARIVQGDPALAGRILKLANSALYAGSRQITAISEAVARIGLQTVWQVCLGFSVITNHQHGRCRQFNYERYWAHSLASAVAAQRMAHFTRIANPEEAFAASLLCQIGRLALACIFPEDYSNVLDAAGGDEEELLTIEQDTFALDHRELTAAMLQDWGIADTWITAARYQENPEDSNLTPGTPAHKSALLLNTSQLFGSLCTASRDNRYRLLQKLAVQAGRIDIHSDRLFPLCDESVQDWTHWGKLLGVKTPSFPAAADIREEAGPVEQQKAETSDPVSPENPAVRILVIDRDPRTVEAVCACIPSDASVRTAENGAEAMKLMFEFNPQIILTDWEVPGLSGVELCRSLRQTKTGQQIHILVLTGTHDDDLLTAALEAGANEYVRKPIVPRVLEARIKAAMRMIGLQQEVMRDKEQIRQNLAAMAVLNRTLDQAALTDSLTGLPNRRCSEERLAEAWAACQRNGNSLSLMILDLDHFKRINDTYGHDIGDQVLRKTAQMIKVPLRASDVACRIGGEEFLVICRDTNLENTCRVAERLRRYVEAGGINVGDATIRITVSIGVASKDGSTRDIQALVKNADAATYQSKASGRNRVTAANKQESAA